MRQYEALARSFNKMKFSEQISTIKQHPEMMCLKCDHNWWGVRILEDYSDPEFSGMDKYELDDLFKIPKEWDYSELGDLVYLLEIKTVDHD